jgi:hypothetical protein
MTVDSLPTFTPLAAKLWAVIPSDSRKKLLCNVYCRRCGMTTITNFSGAVMSGDLLLVGKCAECHGDVARLIESN